MSSVVVERVDSRICSSKIIERVNIGNLSDRLRNVAQP
jgi:hypothetical protein